MELTLPFELHEFVIHEVGRPTYERFFNTQRRITLRTLVSCSLICKAWVPLSQTYLMRDVRLLTRRGLRSMASIVSNPSKPFGSHVVNLSLRDRGQEGVFRHLLPHYLATKLPLLSALEIQGDPALRKHDLFFVKSSLTMYINQFRSLSHLQLYHHRFQSFWDLRRIIVAFPVLTTLHLSNIVWPSLTERPFPPVIFPAPKLLYVWISECVAQNSILWFWAVSSPPKTTALLSKMAGSLPILTASDLHIIMDLTATFPLLFGTTEYRWAEDKQREHWTLTYDLKAEWNAIEFGVRTAAPVIPTTFRRGYIISSTFKFWYNDDFPIFGWAELDQICDYLEHLEELCIEFRMEGTWVKKNEDPTKSILKIAQSFPLTRRRRGLSLGFIVDGKAIPWLLLENVVMDDPAIVVPPENSGVSDEGMMAE